MKKILFGLFALVTLAFVAQTSFANSDKSAPAYHAQLETIENALNKSNMPKGMGPTTNIVVINYTDNIVKIAYPIIYPGQPVLAPRTAARITNDTWTGYTEVRLSAVQPGTGIEQMFYVNPYISPQAIVSVYVSSGQYVVNLTNG